MAKLTQRPQLRQQPKQKHSSSLLIYSTSSLLLCGTTVLLLCGSANGNGNVNAAGNHNFTTLTNAIPTEQRSRRDVAEVQQSTLVPNADGDHGNISGNKEVPTSQSKNVAQNYDNPFRELNIKKRAPNGFIGMRGKKEADDDNAYNPNAMDWDIDPLYQAQIANNDDTVYDDGDDTYVGNVGRFKKAPSAFYGVRGKKFPNQNGVGYNQLNGILRELQEEQLRERMLEDFIGRLAVATAEQNEIIKRAPTGFTGLRGKRPAYDWVSNKWQLGAVDDEDITDEGGAPEKRAPGNAFVGLRGKKDVSNQLAPEYEHQTLFKRSPSESFGGDGKRRFGDFSHKFVAVRGKKDMTAADAGTTAYNLRQRLRYFRNALPALVYGHGMSNLKRAPSGFVGMRGKRAANVPNEASYQSAST